MDPVPPWTTDELEREALELYRLAGFRAAESAPPHRLAQALLGQSAIRAIDPDYLPYEAALVRVRDRVRIYVRADLPPERARFALLHELAHWHLRRQHGAGADTEDACDALAAALLAPRAAFERVIGESSDGFTHLAEVFCCTESWAALRYGEVTGEPTALLVPGRGVRMRGPLEAWPEQPQALAAKTLPGIARATLRDDPTRVVLRVVGRK